MGKVLVINGGNFAAHRIDQINIDTSVHYSVTANLTGFHISSYSQSVAELTSFNATLTKLTGFSSPAVSITMGGVDVTSSVYNGLTGEISIAAVMGNIVINATATSDWDSHSLTQGGINVNQSQTNKFGKKMDSIAQSYNSRISSDIASSIFVESGQILKLSGLEGLYVELIAYSSSATIDTESQNPDTPSTAVTTYSIEHGMTSKYFNFPKTKEEDYILWENNLGYDCYIRISACTNTVAMAEDVGPRTVYYKVQDIPTSLSGSMLNLRNGTNITTSSSGTLKGRLIDYEDANYGKRMTSLDEVGWPILVPSGASITISGLSGLKTECIRYTEPHNVKAFRLTGTNSQCNYITPVTGTAYYIVHPLFKDNSGGDVTENWFTLTSGSENTLTLTNETEYTLYYIFCFKSVSSGAFNIENYPLTYAVTSAS